MIKNFFLNPTTNMNFSQRVGKMPLFKPLQLESMDDDLKISLWNIYDLYILGKVKNEYSYEYRINPADYFLKSIWHNFFKWSVDSIPNRFYESTSEIRKYFFSCEWFKLYQLIEDTVDLVSDKLFEEIDHKKLYSQFNGVLENEFAGYRFIKGILSPITNPHEIDEIKEAISVGDNFTALKGCNIHLVAALSKLSDKFKPDYRNSIKESISAVESVAKILAQRPGDSLGGAIDRIKGQLKLHNNLERGLKQIYAYTSDSDGIRHSIIDDPYCDFDDAKFMLVMCSSFVNYLIAKATKAGIALK